MNKEEAIDAILGMNDAGQMSTTVWEGMGWSFEAFLRFSQLSDSRANKNLRVVQDKMRRSRDPLLKLSKEGDNGTR